MTMTLSVTVTVTVVALGRLPVAGVPFVPVRFLLLMLLVVLVVLVLLMLLMLLMRHGGQPLVRRADSVRRRTGRRPPLLPGRQKNGKRFPWKRGPAAPVDGSGRTLRRGRAGR
ncbi:hypothetical protein OG342_33015 [Streptomyces bobili]|uniref:hypothetical protein n=1 Tax=Streptomyces bobili TaxID=67280 RepID=UPI00224C92AB|nr:hypothetical protein [Streptomyces bobili]MCX5527620.1 hypothetical protein [Streptomyces bobili]